MKSYTFFRRAAALLGLTSFFWSEMAAAQEREIDLCNFRTTFAEEFDSLSVSAWDATKARWTAHTPWRGDFGDAVFADPQPGFPFTLEDGILSITARQDEQGRWRSGLLSSVDPETNGFSQRYGYFEARMKLPPGAGLWPAFWLGTNEPRSRAEPSIEVDVIEHYGHEPKTFQASLHVWTKKPGGGASSKAKHHTVNVPSGSLYSDFNTYGVEVGEDDIVYYFNRREVWRQPTPPELVMPLFPMVNLAMGSGFPIEQTPNPSVLDVDYVRVFERVAPATQKGCTP
jgi:beta-glucanase (GH16 family)